MSNEIDELMDKDPLSLSDRDLDAIIAYQRNARAAFAPKAAGQKGPSVPKAQASSALLDLVKNMGKGKAQPEAPKPTGLRRV